MFPDELIQEGQGMALGAWSGSRRLPPRMRAELELIQFGLKQDENGNWRRDGEIVIVGDVWKRDWESELERVRGQI